jgi:DNA-binding response OmpR family regulator
MSLLPTVLVVDDEHGILVTLAAILKTHGFTVFTARSGEEAVDVAYNIEPDWVVSDVVMGTLSGIDAAIRIREQCPNTQVLLFSGNALTTDLLAEARAHGHHFDILPKPFSPMELLDRLRAPAPQQGVAC